VEAGEAVLQVLPTCPSGQQEGVDVRTVENLPSEGGDGGRRLVRFLQLGFDQFRTPAAMDQCEAAMAYHVPDPISVGSISQREDELLVSFEDVDRRSIDAPRDAPAMHDNAKVGRPGRDRPKDRVRDELVESSEPRRKRHTRTIVG
jgi:hypothetical protein